MSYILPDPVVRARRLPALFTMLIADDRTQGGVQWQTPGGEALTLWLPPGHAAVSIFAYLTRLPQVWAALGTGLGRALKLQAAIEAHYPTHPHWYLHIAGCDPAQQGKGFGGQAIRAGLARADADGLPVYLETATASNVGLYRLLGFRVVGEYDVPRGPHFWGMQRGYLPGL